MKRRKMNALDLARADVRTRNFPSIETQAELVFEAVLASGKKGDEPEVEVAFFVPHSDSRIFGPPQECQGQKFVLRLQFEIVELEQRAAVQEGGGSDHPFQLAGDVFTPAIPGPAHVKYFAWTGKKVKQVVLRKAEVVEHDLPEGWSLKFDFTKKRQINLCFPDGKRFHVLGELPYKVGEEAVVTRKE